MQNLIEFLEQEGFSEEAKCLEENNTTLNITNKQVYIEVLTSMLNILTFNNKVSITLTHLTLDHSFIRSDGLKVISEFLQENTTLILLDLTENAHLYPEAFEPIGEALKFNSTLKYFNFYGNKIGITGAKAIAEGLKVNKSLIHLNLGSHCIWDSNWAIGNQGGAFIAEALKVNNTLTYLNLELSNIKDEGISFFVEALQTNYTLTTLTLNQWLNATIEPEEVEEIIYLNRQLVEKLSSFLINDFSIENKKVNLNIQNLTALKFYLVADKKLLTDYLKEYEDIIDISFLLKAVDNFIKENPFAIAGICKEIEPDSILKEGEIHISHLPTEIISHIINFLKPDTLGIKYSESTLENTEVENMGTIETFEGTKNSYCALL